VAVLVLLYAAAEGWLGRSPGAGVITGTARAPAVAEAERAAARAVAPPDAPAERQILFGDLHVHSIFSTDANLMSLPMMQGDGPHPPADACDFARYCSRLDFFSMNDHAEALTPQRWELTRESIRQCNALTDPANPDMVAFLGYEWTQSAQVDATKHYGHKNVVFRDTEEGKVPVRPIAAISEGLGVEAFVPPLRQRVGLPLLDPANMQPYLDFNRFGVEMLEVPACPGGVNTRELPADCREGASTPAELFRKLDEGGYASIVIPHGNTWGLYTAKNATWDKQLVGEMQDAKRQFLVEVYSGHGNSEEYRDWQVVEQGAEGVGCPAPRPDYTPVCWQAGEIVRGRCLAGGASAETCEQRAAEARQRAAEAPTGREFGIAAGAESAEWLDAGHCRDCFLPAFNYRPGGSTQYALAIGNFDRQGEPPRRLRFGLMASSDVHSARPGTGYKEFARIPMTEARGPGNQRQLEALRDYDGPLLDRARSPEELDAATRAILFQAMERQSSFWLTGGLVAVHADSRRREDIWNALARKEVYGTSGPRILLWFDLLDPESGARLAPMGTEHRLAHNPRFRVRAAGSFEQKPGCPADSIEALGAERLANLCLGECYYPGDKRRPITRIEVVRIRPQQQPGEDVSGLIEDPWRVLPCPPGEESCTVEFEDEQFVADGRESLYYVRAVEAASPAVNADPVRCERDASGACIKADPCIGDFRVPRGEDCLAPAEERAWSSPIFLDQAPLALAAAAES
jgi:hypothetical protein